MGAPDDANYYRMETHYDNPQALSGIIDNSGITYDIRNICFHKYGNNFKHTRWHRWKHFIPGNIISTLTDRFDVLTLVLKQYFTTNINFSNSLFRPSCDNNPRPEAKWGWNDRARCRGEPPPGHSAEPGQLRHPGSLSGYLSRCGKYNVGPNQDGCVTQVQC